MIKMSMSQHTPHFKMSLNPKVATQQPLQHEADANALST